MRNFVICKIGMKFASHDFYHIFRQTILNFKLQNLISK